MRAEHNQCETNFLRVQLAPNQKNPILTNLFESLFNKGNCFRENRFGLLETSIDAISLWNAFKNAVLSLCNQIGPPSSVPLGAQGHTT
jgi:hypothetical protein